MNNYYCKDCGEWPLHARGMCKRCYSRWYARENADKIKAWREEHKEHLKAWRKKHREENRDAFNTYHKLYARRNKCTPG